MLEEVRITQWKSCQSVELEGLGQFTALVGRNGVGKTNILSAIEWAARSASSTSAISAEPIAYDSSSKVELVVRLEGHSYRYSLDVKLGMPAAKQTPHLQLHESLEISDSEGNPVTSLTRSGTSINLVGEELALSVGPDTPGLHAVCSLLPDSPHTPRIMRLLSFLKGVRYYPFDEPNRPLTGASMSWKAAHMAWRATGGLSGEPNAIETVHKLIHILDDRPDMALELKRMIGRHELGLVDDLTLRWIDTGGTDEASTKEANGFYYVQFMIAGSHRSYQELSAGTRRIIRMIVSIVYDDSSVLLLEHPEDTIHKGLLQKVVAQLRRSSDTAQFIVASHSPEVLDQCSADEIRLVTMLEGQTHARRLLDVEVSAAKKYVCEDGSLSDFLPLLEEE